jgi:hypothetical protein
MIGASERSETFERSKNWTRRKAILSTARTIYAA